MSRRQEGWDRKGTARGQRRRRASTRDHPGPGTAATRGEVALTAAHERPGGKRRAQVALGIAADVGTPGMPLPSSGSRDQGHSNPSKKGPEAPAGHRTARRRHASPAKTCHRKLHEVAGASAAQGRNAHEPAANLVWHTTVVAGAINQLRWDKGPSFAPARADREAWELEVGETARTAEWAADGLSLSPTALLREVLSELQAIATPLPKDDHGNDPPIGLILAIRSSMLRL